MKMHNQNCKGIDYWCNRVARIRYGYPRCWIVPNIVYFFLMGLWSSWLARRVVSAKVAGSSPASPENLLSSKACETCRYKSFEWVMFLGKKH